MKLWAFALLFAAAPCMALEISEIWSVNGKQKSLRVNCDAANGAICSHVCNNPFSCDVPESFCRNCAGSSQGVMLDFFKNVGRTYVAETIDAEPTALATLINTKQYVSITAQTPLNFWYPADGAELRARLQLLCPAESIPTVFIRVDAHRRPLRPWFVACASADQVTLRRVVRKFSADDDSRASPARESSGIEIRKAILP